MSKKTTKSKKDNSCWTTIGVWSHAQNRCDRLNDVIHCRNCDVFSMAGRGVFESQPPAGYINEWQKKLLNEKSEREKGDVGVMVFRLGDDWLALPIDNLQEIVEERNIHKIPHNDGINILGLVNIGGEINICYSLLNLLAIKENTEKNINELQRLIVIVINGDKFVLPVCEVSGMARYSSNDLLKTPKTLEKKMGRFLLGVFKIKKRRVAALNIEQISRGFEGIRV